MEGTSLPTGPDDVTKQDTRVMDAGVCKLRQGIDNERRRPCSWVQPRYQPRIFSTIVGTVFAMINRSSAID